MRPASVRRAPAGGFHAVKGRPACREESARGREDRRDPPRGRASRARKNKSKPGLHGFEWKLSPVAIDDDQVSFFTRRCGDAGGRRGAPRTSLWVYLARSVFEEGRRVEVDQPAHDDPALCDSAVSAPPRQKEGSSGNSGEYAARIFKKRWASSRKAMGSAFEDF